MIYLLIYLSVCLSCLSVCVLPYQVRIFRENDDRPVLRAIIQRISAEIGVDLSQLKIERISAVAATPAPSPAAQQSASGSNSFRSLSTSWQAVAISGMVLVQLCCVFMLVKKLCHGRVSSITPTDVLETKDNSNVGESESLRSSINARGPVLSQTIESTTIES
jgi:hypothetical protein